MDKLVILIVCCVFFKEILRGVKALKEAINEELNILENSK